MSLFCCERAPAGIADRHTPRNTNGQGGIRTHGTLAGTPVFETGRFNRSRTCPLTTGEQITVTDAQTQQWGTANSRQVGLPNSSRPVLPCASADEGEERPMNPLPTKKPGDPDVNTIPTWRELAERFRDLVKDFLKEGKELERELEPKLLPALKRFKLEIEKLIAKLEQRAK